jgi:hypothetical protein
MFVLFVVYLSKLLLVTQNMLINTMINYLRCSELSSGMSEHHTRRRENLKSHITTKELEGIRKEAVQVPI